MSKVVFNINYVSGLNLYKKSLFEESKIKFRKALYHQRDHAQCTFKLGMCYFKLEQWKKARFYIEKAINLDPSKTGWKKQLEQSKKHLGIPKQTIYKEENLTLEQKILANPNDAKLYRELASNLQKQGLWWQEIEALKKAIALDNTKADWYYRLGQSLEIMNRYSEASQNYIKAIELKKDKADAEWYYRAGYCYETKGHDGVPNIQKAKDYYAKAIAKDTKLKSKEFGIGAFHQNRGYWEEASKAYSEYLRKNAIFNAELCYRLGMSYDRCYIWDKAEENYKVAISLDSKNIYWHYRLGFVLERQEKFEESALAYEYAAKNSAKFMAYWFYRWAYVLEKLGRYEESAIAYLHTKNGFKIEEHIKVQDEIEEKKDEILEYEIALSEDSNSTLEVIEEEPVNFVLYKNSINSSSILTNHLLSILSKDLTISTNWHTLAKAYEKAKVYEKARDAYIKAINRENEHKPDWYYDLGLVEFKLGLNKEASATLRDARIMQKPYGVTDDAMKNAGFKQSAIYTELYDSLEIDSNLVLFESFHGASMSCNPYALFLYMFEQEEFKNFTYIWVVNDLEKVDEKWKKYENIIFTKRDSYLYMRYLASAKYLINNVTFSAYFIRKGNQKYLNTWHGTPIKYLGKDIKDGLIAHQNVTRNFLHATHAIHPNQHTHDIMMHRNDVFELFEGINAITGYPRIDLMINATEETKQNIKSQLNISNSDKVLLYAPTWRGLHGSAVFDVEKLIADLEKISNLGYKIVFRGHHMVENFLINSNLNVTIATSDIDTNQLLSIVDVLITDYSSIFFDFLIAKKPIIYYAYDIDDYKEERGLYYPLEDMAGKVCYEIDEVVKSLENISLVYDEAKYNKAIKDFASYEDGNVSKRVTDMFINDSIENIQIVENCKKEKLLFYAGSFIPNGITSSFLNLISNIDKDKFTCNVLINGKQIESFPEKVEQLNRLKNSVSLSGEFGRKNQTIEEDWIAKKFNSKNILQSENMWEEYEKIQKREFKRLFGNTNYKSVINFDGYSMHFASILSGFDKNKSIYLHNNMYNEHVFRFAYLEKIFRLYRYYDNLISVSKQTGDLNIESLKNRFDINLDKFDFSDNLISPDEIFEKSNEELEDEIIEKYYKNSKVFLTMGRLSIEKDHKKLIDAFAFLVKEYSNAKLLILGDGPLKLDLEMQIKELRLEENVFLLGRIFNPFPYLKKANCFVLSSNHEGQPMVLLESLTLKKPIVATDIVGNRSVLEGRDGLLVENSSEGLLFGMKEFLSGNLGEVNFDYDAYNKNALESFYNKVCGV